MRKLGVLLHFAQFFFVELLQFNHVLLVSSVSQSVKLLKFGLNLFVMLISDSLKRFEVALTVLFLLFHALFECIPAG